MEDLARVKIAIETVEKSNADFTLESEKSASQLKRKRVSCSSKSSKALKNVGRQNSQRLCSSVGGVSYDSDYECFLNARYALVVADNVDTLADCALPDSDYEKFVGQITGVDDRDRVVGNVSETIDSDYENFLSGGNGNSNREVVYVNCNANRAVERRYDDNAVVDPLYMMFLNNVERKGNAYVLKYSSSVVDYEIEDDDFLTRKNSEEARDKLINEKALVVERNVGLEMCTDIDCRTDFDSDTVDESYILFLKSLECSGHNFVYAPGGDEIMVYEEESDSNDDEVIILDGNAFLEGENDPFESSKPCMIIDAEAEEGAGALIGCKITQFKNNLMEFLQRPYDYKELKYLCREVSRRRLLDDRSLVLRGRVVTYSRHDCVGKSFLDEFKDLAQKMDEVIDHPRALNLLRGFFFWLQNLSHEGSFKPWLDASCLELLPAV